MSLLATITMDITFLVFLSIILLRYSIFKDKEYKGLKWIGIGGLISLIQITIPATDIAQILNITGFDIIVGISINIISFIVVLIGIIVAIRELIE